MKFNTMDNTPSGALLTNILAMFSFLVSVLASPISTAGEANSLAAKANCILGSCDLGGKCFKANSCFGVNLFDPDWSHCGICNCPGQAFGGRTDPKCVMDTDCLNVQLGNRPDPCAHKNRLASAPEIAGREASADPEPQRGDDGATYPYSANPNIKAPAIIPETISISNYLASLPDGFSIDPDVLEKIRQKLSPSHVLDERSELMSEFARLVDDGPSGPVIPDAAMMERLRPITHPEKRGGCYTVENGVTVKKRGGCGDIGVDIEADVKKRGGCVTIENGVAVEKLGGCGTAETEIDADGEVDVNLDKRGGSGEPSVEVGAEKPVGCFVEEDGVVYAKPDCTAKDHQLIDWKHGKHWRRGGCLTVENGFIVEKRGGCGEVDSNAAPYS